MRGNQTGSDAATNLECGDVGAALDSQVMESAVAASLCRRTPRQLFLRPNISKPTAATRTLPLTTYCAQLSTFNEDMPLSRLARINAPSTAPNTVPRPPIKLVPPITHEAIASSSIKVPASGEALPTRAVCRIEASPASAPISQNAARMYRFKLIPDSRAASALPPIA